MCSHLKVPWYASVSCSVVKQKEMVRSGLCEAKQVQQEIVLLRGEIQKQSEQLEHDEFRKEAQCIKLVRELGAIYPISVVDGREESGKNGIGSGGGESRRYLIRGLEIPIDLYNNSTNVVEEEISAALGFCCHLVVMLSKYLGVPLRYRIFCNSSRSAIRQGTIIYPLFTARVVEREQLERGMLLLYANVDCILQTRGIEYNPKSHILARLQRIYRHVIEGDHPHGTLLPE
jgi:Vacuolar sorting 38 and autophagy-related subunit 14